MNLAREMIMNMPAGREMDALIAELFFGYSWYSHPDTSSLFLLTDDESKSAQWTLASKTEKEFSTLGSFACYSTDIAAAWQVWNRLFELGHWLQVNNTCDAGKVDLVIVVNGLTGNPRYKEAFVFEPFEVAVCRAALFAVWFVKNEMSAK
jgi:hypothetical protein